MGVAPEIFDVPDEGPVEVLKEHPSEDMRSEAEEAARVCPTQAITIEESAPDTACLWLQWTGIDPHGGHWVKGGQHGAGDGR